MLSDLRYRLRALFERRAMESELDEELRYHLDRQSEKLQRAGIPAAESMRQARIALGGPEQVREQCRDARGTRWLEDLSKDVRYGFRILASSPAFAGIAVLSLALGIGANTAIFSVADTILLRPMPYQDPSKLVMIWDTFPERSDWHNVVGPADYLRWQRESSAFEAIAAINADVSNLTGVDDPQEIRGQMVTANLLPLLGVSPALGRGFTEEEARSKAKVVVLGHRFWEQRFHANAAALGRTVELDSVPYTVIGVMPPNFEFLDSDSQYWVPYFVDPLKDYSRTGRYLRAIARLKPGFSMTQAVAQMKTIAARAERGNPNFSKGWGVRLVDLREEISGEYRQPVLVLLGAVGLVLLIACANIASLLLARATSRSREMAIRTSLGAGPWRIARQLLAESGVLAALGGALGLLLAVWSVDLVKRKAPFDLPQMAAMGVNARVMLFAVAMALAATLLFGVGPALAGAKSSPAGTLKEGARGGVSSHRRRLLNGLVAVEIALSVVLLAGSGLLIRSFANLLAVDTGFRADHLLTARILLRNSNNSVQPVEFFRQATERIQALPGVRSASAVSFMPFGGMRPGTDFFIENRPKPEPGKEPMTEVRSIEPGYFRTMGIPLLRGRDFTDRDGSPEHPVFIINRSLAEKYWPTEDPIGQRISVEMTRNRVFGEIVGIAADVKDQALDGHTEPSVFYAYPGLPIGLMALVVRTSGDPAALGAAVRDIVHSLDRNQPVAEIQTMDQMLRHSVASRHFQMMLLAGFAGIALLLSVVGLYGVVSYSVAQRTAEIGIRMALGASRASVLRLVVSQGGGIVLGGLLLGLAGAFALTRTIAAFLFGVRSDDPVTFGAVTSVLLVVALAALIGPARRASRVDPLICLRYE
jgi:putative ABC transport system permease protein